MKAIAIVLTRKNYNGYNLSKTFEISLLDFQLK